MARSLPVPTLEGLAGVAHASVSKVDSLGDGVLGSLKGLLLLLLALDQAEEVHGLVATVTN